MVERPGRVYLDVPFAEKDQAKAAGARWDAAAKRWYDPSPDPAGTPRTDLRPWGALPDVPDLLPGEDRQFGEGLFVDPVPEYWRRVSIWSVRYSASSMCCPGESDAAEGSAWWAEGPTRFADAEVAESALAAPVRYFASSTGSVY